MISRWMAAIACVALVGAAGLAEAKTPKTKKAAGTPIDGTWNADGTVTVAKHISGASVGQTFTRTWTVKSKCSGACKTTLSYHTSSGHQIVVPLAGKGANWKGTLEHQTFPCTDGGTATGSLSFKLHVAKFTTKKKHRIASAISATGTQEGSGCADVKEVVKFSLKRA